MVVFYFTFRVCRAEVNAILTTNHATAAGQVSSNVVGISFSACYPVGPLIWLRKENAGDCILLTTNTMVTLA